MVLISLLDFIQCMLLESYAVQIVMTSYNQSILHHYYSTLYNQIRHIPTILQRQIKNIQSSTSNIQQLVFEFVNIIILPSQKMDWKDNIGCRALIDLLQFIINEEKNTQKKVSNEQYNTQKRKSFSGLWNKVVHLKQYLSQYFQHFYHSNCIINLSIQDIRQLMYEVGLYSPQNYHIIKRCLFNDRKSITMKLNLAKGQEEEKQEQWSFRSKNQGKGKDRQRVINTILQKIEDLQKNFQSKRKLSENKRREYLPESSFKARLFYYDRQHENSLQRSPERYYMTDNLTHTAPTDRFQYRDKQLRERNPNKIQFRQNQSDYLDDYSLKNKSLLLARAESLAKMKIKQIEQKAIQKVAYYHRQSAQRKLTSSLRKNQTFANEKSNYRCSATFLDNWNKYACSRKNISGGQKLRL